MSVNAVVTIIGNKVGAPVGYQPIGPLMIVNPASGGSVTDPSLSTGNNTITVPSATLVGCLIVPPQGNTTALILKGVAGDTGLTMHLTNPTLYSFPAGTSSFVINAAGSLAGLEIIWF